MTSAATLFGIAILGTVFWPASPEAAAALFASSQRSHPLTVGLLAGGGQAVALTVLFLFGDQLRARWGWFDRKCERLRARLGPRLANSAFVVASVSGLVGFPPVSLVATLAPGVAPRPAPLLPVMIVTRIVRFTVLAALVGAAASKL